MAKRVVIVGAVALGPKVACRVRRLDPDAEIIMVDRDNLFSYGGCGIPYYVSGDVPELEELYSTSAHVIRDADFFRTSKGVDIMSRVEAVGIDRRKKKLLVRHQDDGKQESLDYDKLVIATGATPIKPPITGVDLPMVFTVSNLHSAKDIKDKISQGQVGKAVVIGAGAIGIEMAEALTDLWGVETTIVEMADHVLPTALGKNISKVAENHLVEKGVKVLLSDRVAKINGDPESGVTSVETGSGPLACDMVVMSAGIRPNTGLAKEAGLAVGLSGALLVDRNMRTTDPHIYAGGDCVELRNLVNGENTTMPLGSLPVGQGPQGHGHIFSADQVSQFHTVPAGIDVGIRGSHIPIHKQGSGETHGQTGFLCQRGVGPNSGGHDHHVTSHGPASGFHRSDAVFRVAIDFYHSIGEQNFYPLFNQMVFHDF